MITRGYLILSDTDEETGVYAIPITNFPTLLPGTPVRLELPGYIFEDLYIKNYVASNTHGTLVFTRSTDFDTPSPGAPNRAELEKLFVPHTDNQFDYSYPETISFG